MDRKLHTTGSYTQKILGLIKGFALPLTRELRQELSAVREKNKALQQELQTVNSRLEGIGKLEEKRLDEVQQRMDRLESDRDTTHLQLQNIHATLSDALNRQGTLDGRLESQEGKLKKQHMAHQTGHRFRCASKPTRSCNSSPRSHKRFTGRIKQTGNSGPWRNNWSNST